MNYKEITKLVRGKENKEVIELYRAYIDELSTLGYVVAVSQELLALRNLVDFSSDGFKIFRCKDITDIILKEKNDSLKFIDMIYKKEFKFDDCSFSDNIKTWKSFVQYLINSKTPVTLECSFEDATDYYVGWITEVNANIVTMQCFDGGGILFKDKVRVNLDFLTCITVGDRYTSYMSKYVTK